jgi:hypothetical protein
VARGVADKQIASAWQVTPQTTVCQKAGQPN